MKVCILAAGQGKRMGKYSGMVHKALLPLGNKAVLSRIIEQFPADCKFVIAVGFKGSQLIDYIRIAHPDLAATFVYVSNYDGAGSGPGFSLFSCREHLQEPFFFSSCDTLITSPLPLPDRNWIGVRKVTDIEKWCSVKTDSLEDVTAVFYKTAADTDLAFVGISFVRDYAAFWDGFANDNRLYGGELQVNNGLEAIIPHGLKAVSLDWEDTGNAENYESLLGKYEDNYTFAGKDTDITYRLGERIIKYFPDEGISRNRYERALQYKGIFADVDMLQGNFYSYHFLEGRMLSDIMSYSECAAFLEWAEDRLWRTSGIEHHPNFKETVRRFYFDKTMQRLGEFRDKYLPDRLERDMSINGIFCRTVAELLRLIDCGGLSFPVPSLYHGDLHADNIIKTENGYRLIDWRQSFGDSVDAGDRYYDLAKFLHTLEFPVKSMSAGTFSVNEEGENVRINHDTDYVCLEALEALREFIERRRYDLLKVQIINALIYVNMAPLYEKDLAVYLYYLGRYSLQKVMDRGQR